MARKSLTEDKYIQVLFQSSDEEDSTTMTFEADSVHDDLHDARTWQKEAEETQLLNAQPDDVQSDGMQDLFASQAVNLHSLALGPPLATHAPSSMFSGPSSASSGPSSVTLPGPSSVVPPVTSSVAPPVPPSASPVPPSTSAIPAAVPEDSHSPVELSRNKRRGPLCPAEGVVLKRLPDNSYKAKDNTKWYSEPNSTLPPIMQTDQFDNVGPTMNVSGCKTPAEVFSKFLPDALLVEVFHHTNDKIIILRNKFKRQNDPTFKDLTLIELRAFLGILIMTGARKDNHLTTEEIFSKSFGCPFYRSVMSEGRFAFIQRALQFDSLATRSERVKTDKFAAIRSLWDQVIANCIANYKPSRHLTVDEQLLAFRGRCGFMMYIPNKPAKYGIKLFMACDAETYYMCNAIPYLGKGTVTTSTPLGEYFTLELTRPFRNSERIVTTDNWFTSLPLAKGLRQYGMHLVGTILPKPYLPSVMLTTKLELGECVAAYNYEDKVTLLCQRVKAMKRIQILSTVHHDPTVIENNKSHIHMFHKATKGGVDTFDQICSAMTCNRKTQRWPVCVFFGILNIVVNNSFYIHQTLPGNKLYNRKQFSMELAMELSRDWALSRLENKRYLPRDVTYLICSVFEVKETDDDTQDTQDTPKRSDKRQRCPLCPSSSNARTKLLCVKCHRPACNTHVNYVCDECHYVCGKKDFKSSKKDSISSKKDTRKETRKEKRSLEIDIDIKEEPLEDFPGEETTETTQTRKDNPKKRKQEKCPVKYSRKKKPGNHENVFEATVEGDCDQGRDDSRPKEEPEWNSLQEIIIKEENLEEITGTKWEYDEKAAFMK